MAEASKKLVYALRPGFVTAGRQTIGAIEQSSVSVATFAGRLIRRLAERHRIGSREGFLEGFVQQFVQPLQLCRPRRRGRLVMVNGMRLHGALRISRHCIPDMWG